MEDICILTNAVVRFCYHSCDYRPSWSPLSPITIISQNYSHDEYLDFPNYRDFLNSQFPPTMQVVQIPYRRDFFQDLFSLRLK